MRLGICTLLEGAEQLRGCGLDYLEGAVGQVLTPGVSDREWEATRKKVAALPLPLEAACSFIPADMKTTGPEVDCERLDAYVRTAFRRAGEIGMKVIVFGSGDSRKVPEDFAQARAFEQLTEHLRRWGEWAGESGVTVVIEPLNEEETNIICSVAEGQRLVEAVNHPNIRLLADLYHMGVANENPETLSKTKGLLAHVHLAEVVDRKFPGCGGQDFRPYFRELEKAGYQGRMSMECRWDDPSAQAKGAVEYMREQMEHLQI